MPDIYEEVGKQIRELRTGLRGRGISQEELAQAVKTTANTISRWETATYKPSISDLDSWPCSLACRSQLSFRKPSRSHARMRSSAPRRTWMTTISLK